MLMVNHLVSLCSVHKLKFVHYSYMYIKLALLTFCAEHQKQKILDGMRHWEDKTCIRFKQKQPQDRNFVLIDIGPWCVGL